jgi:phosphopantothenoylcysteine decarboxylase/phosphopantothenate--cysteine ligase
MLKGKTVLLGVTGGIAAYKMPNIARMLKKLHCNVQVIMTEHARNFITPTTFETLTGNKCIIDTFDRNFTYSVEHVALAKQVDLVLIAPATANIIGKIASGIADNMLTTTVMACTCKILIAPAMNHNMYLNPIVQDNLDKLRKFGYEIIPPVTGMLANGDIGNGKLPEEPILVEYIKKEIAFKKDLLGKRVLVTAGPTQESIDPVRYISNRSTGKMGYAIAKAAMYRGAEVTLVTGPVAIDYPLFVNVLPVVTASEMYGCVMSHAPMQDIIIKAAAVSDYCPATICNEKIKKRPGDEQLQLCRTRDILASLGTEKKDGKIRAYLCGFSMETEHMLENSRAKLERKQVDMIVANNLKVEGAGFGTETNVLTMLTSKREVSLELMNKEEAAHRVLDEILKNEATSVLL